MSVAALFSKSQQGRTKKSTAMNIFQKKHKCIEIVALLPKVMIEASVVNVRRYWARVQAMVRTHEPVHNIDTFIQRKDSHLMQYTIVRFNSFL